MNRRDLNLFCDALKAVAQHYPGFELGAMHKNIEELRSMALRSIEQDSAGFMLSTWAATIHWDGSANTPEWMADLKAKVLAVQALQPSAADVEEPGVQRYYIRSHKHDQNNPNGNELALWWGPESKGYTYDLRRAGRYEEAEALSICGPFGLKITPAKRGAFGSATPGDIAYPVELVDRLAMLVGNKFDVENERLRGLV